MVARKSLKTMSGAILNRLATIATKVCSRIGRKWNAMFESHVVTSVDRTSFDFQFKDFWINLTLQTIIYCVTDQQSITQFWRSVLNFKFSVLAFQCQDSATRAGLAHGRDYRKSQKVLSHCFPLNCRNYLKTMALAHSEGFSNLTPQTASQQL